jgi:hypothetical protein
MYNTLTIHWKGIYNSKTCSNLEDKGKSNLQECENKIDVHAHTFEYQDHGGIFPFACNDARWLHYNPSVKDE